jgi:hypothetical protein
MVKSVYVPEAGGIIDFPDEATPKDIVAYVDRVYGGVGAVPTEQPTGPDESTLLGRAAYGFATGLTDIPSGIAALAMPAEQVAKTTAGRFSEDARKYLQETFGIDPTKDPTAAQQAAEALGSVGSFLVPATGAAKIAALAGRGAKIAGAAGAAADALAAQRAARLAGSVTAAGQGVALGAAQRTQTIQQQLASGMEISPEDQLAAQRLDAFIGIAEAAPLERFFGPLTQILSKVPASKAPLVERIVKSRLSKITRAGVAEGAQEAASGIANDLVEYGVYNPDVEFGQDLLSNAGTGAFAGSFVEGVIQLAAGRKLRGARQLQQDIAAEKQQNAIAARQGLVSDAAEKLRQYNIDGPVEVVEDEIENVPIFSLKTPAGNVIGEFADRDSLNEAVGIYNAKTGAKVEIREPAKIPDIFPVKIGKKKFDSLDAVRTERDNLISRIQAAKVLATDPIRIKEGASKIGVSEPLYQKKAQDNFDKLVREVEPLEAFVFNAQPTPPSEPVGDELGPDRIKALQGLKIAPTEPLAEASMEPVEAVSAVEPSQTIGATETAPAPSGEGIAAIPEPPSVSEEITATGPTPVDTTEQSLSAGPLPEVAAPRKPVRQIEAETVTPRDYTPEQKALDQKVYSELRTRLSSIVPAEVSLKVRDVIDTQPGYLVRGFVRSDGTANDMKVVVEIAQGVIDPRLPVEDNIKALMETLNHEIIHVVRRMGLIRPAEWNILSRAARSAKVPGKKYTYLDKAEAVYAPNGEPITPEYADPEVLLEEAVAEMYKDWVINRTAPKNTAGLFNRITEFFRRIFRTLKSNAQEAVFKRIESGEVGKREVAPVEVGQRFSASPLPGGSPLSRNLEDKESREFGLYPYLRTAASRYYDHKPKITGTTNPNNAAAQIANLDQLLRDHPNTLASDNAWADYAADALGRSADPSTGVPLAPYKAVLFANNPRLIADQIGRMTPGQLRMAEEGLSAAKEFEQAYKDGTATPVHTAKLILWGILSRGVSPFVQESMFLDVVKPVGISNRTGKLAGGIDQFIQDAIDGEFDLEAYKDYVGTLKIDGLPGAGTTHNLGAFGETTLVKLQQRVPDGRTLLQYLHDLIQDYSLSGKDIRRLFHTVNPGIGINNKVLSFVLLVTGRDDVMVLDRVQMRNQFNDGTFNDYNLYDGIKIPKEVRTKTGEIKTKNVTDTGSGIAHLGDGIRGLMYYEALERDLAPAIRKAYGMLNRGNQYSMGRYHWESWVATSAQEVDHGSISGLLKDAVGEVDPYRDVYTGEGKYNTYNSGMKYGYTDAGEAYIGLPDGLGRHYYFTPEYAKKVVEGYEKRSTGIIRDPIFKVSTSVEGPWYDRPEVDKQKLRNYLRAKSEEFRAERGRAFRKRVQEAGKNNATSPGPGPVNAVGRRGGVRQPVVTDAKSIADKYVKRDGGDVRFSAAPLPSILEQKNKALFAPAPKKSFKDMIFDFFLGEAPTETLLTTQYGQTKISALTRAALIGRTAAVDRNAMIEFLEKQENLLTTGDMSRLTADYSPLVSLLNKDRASHLFAAAMLRGNIAVNKLKTGDILSATLKVEDSPDNLMKVFELMLQPGPPDPTTNEPRDKREIFRLYATAKRAIGLKAEGKRVPKEMDDNFIKTTISFTEQSYPEIVEAYKMYQRFNRSLLKAAVDAELITPESFANLTKNMDYYGYYYEVFEEVYAPGMPKKVAGRFNLRPYKGTELGGLANDPMQVMLQNSMFWTEAIAKNLAARKSFELARRMGVARLLGTGEDPDRGRGEEDQVMFFRDKGVDKRFAVSDPLLVSALGSDDRIDVGKFWEMIGLPTQVLRETITRDPGFMVANLMRDTLSAWITSGADIMPFIGTVKGFANAYKNGASFQALQGRGVVGSYDLAMLGPADLAKRIRSATKPKGVTNITSPDALIGVVGSLWNRLGAVSEMSDAATRIAVYDSAIKQGFSEAEAAFRALEIMNFSRRGASQTLSILTKLVPFLNARIQGLDVLYQAGKGAVKIVTGRQQGQRDADLGKKFLIRGGMLAAISVALEMLNDDDEDYQQLDDYIKNSNVLIPLAGFGLKGQFIAVPKPFEAGLLFSTFPQQFYKTATGQASTRENAALFFSSFASTFGVNPIPQFMLPPLEVIVNHDFYTGLPLISEGKARLAPELQYNSGTSSLAMMLGKVPISYNFTTGKFEGVSPIVIDNLISGYTGPFGTYIVQAASLAMEGVDAGPERLPRSVSQLPVVRRFFIDSEYKNPKVVSQAYELFRVVDEANRSYSRLRQIGDAEAVKDYLDENRDILSYKKYVFKLVDGLNKLSAQERRIESDQTMTRAEKFEAMAKLRETRMKLAAKVTEINAALGR